MFPFCFVGSVIGWLVGLLNFHTGTGICSYHVTPERWCSPGKGLMNGFQRRASGITMRQIQRLVFQGCVGGGRDLLRWAASAFIDATLSRESVRESSVDDMKAPPCRISHRYGVQCYVPALSFLFNTVRTLDFPGHLLVCDKEEVIFVHWLHIFFMAICKIKRITIEAVTLFRSRRSALFAPLPTCACDPKLSSSLLLS